jgi:hypothetical protein
MDLATRHVMNEWFKAIYPDSFDFCNVCLMAGRIFQWLLLAVLYRSLCRRELTGRMPTLLSTKGINGGHNAHDR